MRLLALGLLLVGALLGGCNRDEGDDVPNAKPIDPAKRSTPPGGAAHPNRRGTDEAGT